MNVFHFIHRIHLNDLYEKLLEGLVAFIIALPMALAFSVASGIGPIASVYWALPIGFFALIFGTPAALISEPTGLRTIFLTAAFLSLITAGFKLTTIVILLSLQAFVAVGLMQQAKRKSISKTDAFENGSSQ